MSKSPVSFLLIEDDSVVIESLQKGFKEAGMNNPLYIARDGAQGLDLLRGHNGESRVPHPLIVILDLQLPKLSGLDFLAEARSDPELSDTIVFVLTTSNDDRDKSDSYGFNISGYLLKENAGSNFSNLVDLLRQYITIIEFPRKPKSLTRTSVPSAI